MAALAGCPSQPDFIECRDDGSCDLRPGGRCLENPQTGHQFCAYPDGSCESGMRWSGLDVEETISGECVGAAEFDDGGIDAPSDTDAMPDAGPDEPPECYTTLSGGLNHHCGLHGDGTLTCWGGNDEGEVSTPGGSDYVKVSTGMSHSCALRADGSVVCWGGNYYGETTAPDETFVDVSAGRHVTCAVRSSDNVISCWGKTDDQVVTARPKVGTFAKVSIAEIHGCAITTSGAMTCWGAANGTTGMPSAGAFSEVATSLGHSCARATNGTLACWGSALVSQPPTGTHISVTAGYKHGCAVRTNNTVTCWGDNMYDQTEAPVGAFIGVSAGYSHTCAITSAGTVMCWGLADDDRTTPPFEGACP